jgi:hypothetical protein
VPISTLLGIDDHPAHLHGYGPITADIAHRLAANSTWRRLLTDPATGALLDYGTTRYTPPADLQTLHAQEDRRHGPRERSQSLVVILSEPAMIPRCAFDEPRCISWRWNDSLWSGFWNVQATAIGGPV